MILNGPNLNFLGIREKEVYGTRTYQELYDFLKALEKKYPVKLKILQSNHEGDLIDCLQEAYFRKTDAIIINPGALTHYSYALRDAIKSVEIPTAEVHLSDISQREDFRKLSVISGVCQKTIQGKGFASYEEAIAFFVGEQYGISEEIQ